MRGAAPASLVITPAVWVHEVAPDSKPGLASRLPPVGGGVVPPQVSVGVTATPFQAFSVAVHCVDVAPYRSLAALTMPFAACG